VRPYTQTSNFIKGTPVLATTTPNATTIIPYVDPTPIGPVGSADQRMMGYSFRLCITPTAHKQAPFFPPPNYNPADFVLLQRYVQSLVDSGINSNGPKLGDIVDILYYRNYPPGDKYDMCDGPAAFTSDAINLNEGYVEGTYEERQEIVKNTYYYVLGLVYFLATDASVPNFTRANTNSYGLCNDQWV
jgi:FAD dependent oxidoreductase